VFVRVDFCVFYVFVFFFFCLLRLVCYLSGCLLLDWNVRDTTCRIIVPGKKTAKFVLLPDMLFSVV
jgi:hypothetical protein